MSAPHPKHALKAVCDVVRPWMLDSGAPVDTCVLTCRFGWHALRAVGLTPRVAPVWMRALNPLAVDLLREERSLPKSEEDSLRWLDRGAWIVEIDERVHTPGRFAGHLILGCGGWWCDPSLDQSNRPAKGIYLERWVERLPRFPRLDAKFLLRNGECLVVYRNQSQPQDWTQSNDWRGVEAGEAVTRHVVSLFRRSLR